MTCAQGDIAALKMIDSLPSVDPGRRDKIMQVLDIDPTWRMHRVSDGQRRRVQICMGLLHPPEVSPLRMPMPISYLFGLVKRLTLK